MEQLLTPSSAVMTVFGIDACEGCAREVMRGRARVEEHSQRRPLDLRRRRSRVSEAHLHGDLSARGSWR